MSRQYQPCPYKYNFVGWHYTKPFMVHLSNCFLRDQSSKRNAYIIAGLKA